MRRFAGVTPKIALGAAGWGMVALFMFGSAVIRLTQAQGDFSSAVLAMTWFSLGVLTLMSARRVIRANIERQRYSSAAEIAATLQMEGLPIGLSPEQVKSARAETARRLLSSPLSRCCSSCVTDLHTVLRDRIYDVPELMMVNTMIVCSECGNKRCPKATDHRLTCTRSNEPGQAGSRYA